LVRASVWAAGAGWGPRVQSSSGLSRVLIFAAAVIAVLATLRIQTRPTPKPGPIWGQPAGVSQPAEPVLTGEQQALLARILAAWKKRKEAAGTFSFTWDSKISQPDGYANVAIPQSGWWEDGDGRFREDSLEVEYDDDGNWRQIAGARLIHDGSLSSQLIVPQASTPHVSVDRPWITIWQGGVRNPTSKHAPQDLLRFGRSQFTPLRLALWPMNANLNQAGVKCQIVNEDAETNGVHCVEIRINNYSDIATYWVDPKRDDVVVRWDAGTLSVVIDYQHDPKNGWLPSHWSWSRRDLRPAASPSANSGPPWISDPRFVLFDGTVRSYSIGESIPAATFAQSYPANTLVYDVTAGSEEDWKSQQVSVKELADEQARRMRPQSKAAPQPARSDQPVVSKENRATLETIEAAWAKRRAKIQSFQISWRRNHAWSSTGWRHGPTAMSYKAWAQGDRFALEFRTTGDTANYPGSKQHSGMLSFGKTAFDGTESRGLSGTNGRAWVQTRFSAADMHGADECVWLALCPWDARFTRLDPARMRVMAQHAKVGEADCVMLRNDWSTFLWLDRARDFLVLRKQEIDEVMAQSRVDFSYRPDASNGWAPTGWSERRVGWNSQFGTSLDDAVQDVTFNRPIPASTFAVEFPKNAAVEDLDPEQLREERARKQADATIAERWAKASDAKSDTRPHFDPKFDAGVDLEKALKAARETKRRVLIEFGGKASPDSYKLYETVTQKAETAAILKQNFVLLLVDTDYHDAGQLVLMKYVPDSKQDQLPLLTVMAPDETVLDTSDTTELKTGDSYAAERLKAYLAKWAPHE